MASLATIFRQVEREGRRWGLVPVIRDGQVKVCEMVAEIVARPPGCMVIPERIPRVVCSLDENSAMDAWSMVLQHRLKREHHDFMRMVRRRADRLAATARAEMDLRRKDLRSQIQSRVIQQRIMSIGR